MVLTTTGSLENGRIAEYKGLVTGEAPVIKPPVQAEQTNAEAAGEAENEAAEAANKAEEKEQDVNQMFPPCRAEMQKARAAAFGELEQNAASIGGNAVVGVSVSVETVHGITMVVAVGTAVRAVNR